MKYRYAVYLVYRWGIMPASTPYYFYISSSLQDAYDHISTRGYALSKGCRAVVKDLVTKEKHGYRV